MGLVLFPITLQRVTWIESFAHKLHIQESDVDWIFLILSLLVISLGINSDQPVLDYKTNKQAEISWAKPLQHYVAQREKLDGNL